ncbi:MAG TPA: UDP-N-acetylmuramoyl-L-alanine--D-glutamate ligase, partial [Lacunisphaera sp.]|nr:UDP-N-acetylmuramoyl-L-alanine--D-glutamate ligase [Lacunisphaera sp.]
MLPKPPNSIATLLARPVAVLGAGVSGEGVLGLLGAIGATGAIYDERAEKATHAFTPEMAATHGLVVYSPGFTTGHPWLAVARGAGCVCLGELDFASLFWRGELVAITGTNGKTSLTEFLVHALTTVGRPAHVAGNIGYPLSRLVVEQAGKPLIAICEVSSFQAETLQYLRPAATLWTNFAEDHLERHLSMAAYFKAKCRLLERTMPGGAFIGSSVQRYTLSSGQVLPPASALPTEDQPADIRLGGTVFSNYPQRENFILAAAWWRQAGLPMAALYEAAHSFKIGDHRLGRLGTKNGVAFWNDSKATNFHAVEAALGTFGSPVLWIGGGKAKGGDLAGFVHRIARKVRHAFLIGETQADLLAHCAAVKVPATACSSLAEAVREACAKAAPGD